MEADTTVRIRERCSDCDGSGSQRVQAGAGHVSWARRVDCPTCEGSGLAERWIPLGELKRLLEESVSPG